MRFNMTPEDFLKGTLLTMGWYPSQIVAYEEKLSPAKTDNNTGKYKEASMYIELQFKVTDGEFKGVVLYGNFSEKAPGMIAPVLEALGAKIDKSKIFDVDLTRDKFLGKTLDIHVVRGTFNSKPKNEVDGYKAYTGKGAVLSAPATPGV